MGTTAYIGDKAESEARDSLEAQIERHLRDASVEAAATIGERFRKIQYGVLDVSANALRDAFQEVRFFSFSSCNLGGLVGRSCCLKKNQSLCVRAFAPPFSC